MQCGFNITETKAKSSDFQLVFQHDTVKQKHKTSRLPHSAFGEVKVSAPTSRLQLKYF